MLPEKRQKGIAALILEDGSNNRQIVRRFGNTTMPQVVESSLPSIGALERQYSTEKTENVIGVILQEASTYFGDAMPQGQALEVAAEITTRYKWLKLEDVFVAFNEMKDQNIYGKLTPNKILSRIKKYSEDRLQYAAERSRNAHLARKENRDEDERDKYDKDFRDFAKRYAAEKLIEKDKANKEQQTTNQKHKTTNKK